METGRWGLSQEVSGLSLQSEPPGGDRSDQEQKGLLPLPEQKQTRGPRAHLHLNANSRPRRRTELLCLGKEGFLCPKKYGPWGRRNQPGMLSRGGTPPCAPAPVLHLPGLPTPELARAVLRAWAAKTPWLMFRTLSQPPMRVTQLFPK